MDKRYFEVAARLNEATHKAIYIAKNINYRPPLDQPELDGLTDIIPVIEELEEKLYNLLQLQHGYL